VEDFDRIVTDDTGAQQDLAHISDRGVPVTFAKLRPGR
jgi:hypothetical protein